jgi:hypothetical protein
MEGSTILGWIGLGSAALATGALIRSRVQPTGDDRQMVEFTALIKEKLGEAISYQYKTYEDYPHVPFPCLYDGLRFVTARRS